MIALKHISKIYGKQEKQALAMLAQGADNATVAKSCGVNIGLFDINLTMADGEITCIMGLSGSGKSTLVRHINRLIDPSAGEVWIDNVLVTQLSLAELRAFRRQRMSMVFQHFALLPHQTVLQNTEYALRVRGENKKQRREKARYWLDEVGLANLENRYPEALSGGQRQRVGLARALAADTDIILMDEAFSALDPLIRKHLQTQLLDLQQRLKKTIVFITHDVDEAVRLGNQIAILKAGRLIQVGTATELRQAPVNDYVAEFMGSHNAINHAASI